MVEPGEWRVRESLQTTARALGVDLEMRPDRHFLCSREEFARHAKGRKQLRMEFFYREMRRQHRVLMDGDEPAGGAWNFDAENRASFGKEGPARGADARSRFHRMRVTCEVLALVEKQFAKHPGSLAHFDWPVTPEQARAALAGFRRAPVAGLRPVSRCDVDRTRWAAPTSALRQQPSFITRASRPR